MREIMQDVGADDTRSCHGDVAVAVAVAVVMCISEGEKAKLSGFRDVG